MSTTVVFSILLAGVLAWILVVRRLTAKSWESRSPAMDVAIGDVGEIGLPPARLGLRIFLAVVTSLFCLFLSAYAMRLHNGHDWHHIILPNVLWVNTMVLILASVGMERARRAGRNGQMETLKISLLVAGVLTFAFLGGQLAAWQQLSGSGQFLWRRPAVAFFYVLTAVHGLHLLGGLFAWGKTMGRLAGGAELIDVRLSTELCATYWHFLLLVWLILFAVLLST